MFVSVKHTRFHCKLIIRTIQGNKSVLQEEGALPLDFIYIKRKYILRLLNEVQDWVQCV